MLIVYLALLSFGGDVCFAQVQCKPGADECAFTAQRCSVSDGSPELITTAGKFRVTGWHKGGRSGTCRSEAKPKAK